jgi:rRNA maturation protein Nop10
MVDVPPPGRLAQSLGANAIATCTCGSNIFYPLVKLTPEVVDEQLVCLKCAACGEETVVPLDPKREQIIKPFDKKRSDEMNRIRAKGLEPDDEL